MHESGHVLGAWLTGGQVTKVVLHPLTISRTDVSPNPGAVIEVWTGPVWGAAFPVVVWMIARGVSHLGLAAWLQFFAGFCLIANGCYLGYGVIEPVGDAEELVRLGTPAWCFALFGLITIPGGFWLWHGLGPAFGMGREAQFILWKHAAWVSALLAILITLEVVLSRAIRGI